MEDVQKEYERIKKYASPEKDRGRYDLFYKEIQALIECPQNTYDMVCIAFNYGFEKGCRKTRKELVAV